jgi:hypothetical protein
MSRLPRYAGLLRRELCARNASYATLEQVPHVTSYGEMPVVVYQAASCGKKHGNFISASYQALLRRPEWRKRFAKVHSTADRVAEERLRLEGTRLLDELGRPADEHILLSRHDEKKRAQLVVRN